MRSFSFQLTVQVSLSGRTTPRDAHLVVPLVQPPPLKLSSDIQTILAPQNRTYNILTCVEKKHVQRNCIAFLKIVRNPFPCRTPRVSLYIPLPKQSAIPMPFAPSFQKKKKPTTATPPKQREH